MISILLVIVGFVGLLFSAGVDATADFRTAPVWAPWLKWGSVAALLAGVALWFF